MKILILTLAFLSSSISLFSQNEDISCNNWLSLPSYLSAVSVGDLDISGNQVTLEAMFVRTTSYSNGYQWAGDLVSKHVDPNNVNYLLRPNNAEITTSNGYFTTPQICEIELNKLYHVAMVYNGSILKFYRNGFLMSSVPATGNLFQNNFLTKIGLYDALVHNTNLIGYINEVRIWNIARTQDEIRTYMNSSLPNPTTQTGLLAYYTFDNLINKQGNTIWNGTLTGSAQINQFNPVCNFTADSCRVLPCSTKNDFSFSFNPCNPNNVSFLTSATGYNSIRWDFGDGNTASNTTSPQNIYVSQGNYVVTLITDYATCSDTVKKTLTITVQADQQLITTNDTTFCPGYSKQLFSNPGISFCWSPTTYLSNPNSPNPITTPAQPITYYLTSLSTGTNLIANGDFSAGNTGFTSQYHYTPNNTTEGEYYVGTNPQAWYPAHYPCTDHTTGTGNMMLVNGSPTPNVEVWRTTVPVTPNTNYTFSTWISSISNPNPAQLSFSINGNDIGSNILATVPPCNWSQFYTNWNSGTNTSATISILNKNTIAFGNDFALDDISFAPITIKKDSVKITLSCLTPCSTKNDFSFSFNPCNPNNVSFLTSATGYNSIRWDFGDGNTASSTTSPQNTYSSQGNYVVTMITDYTTCTDTVTKTITIAIQNDNLLVSTNDTTICNGQTKQLLASSGLSYCWSPSTYLSNTSISNPVTSTPQSITYYLQSLVSGNNLITNGDFSTGNTGFTSQYHYTPNNTTEGEYYVGTNPQAWYPAHHPCTDHTSGNGRMLLVNGSPTPNVEVWRTTVPVAPNTNYSFSTWICSISSPNPAQLSFSINGNSIGGLINASLPTCTWSQFYTVWNSGSDNTATISIVNKNIIAFGNDFALDDISFSPITIRRDSVRIIVDTPLINATHHANICLGDTVHLNVTGAVTYSWSPPTGLTNASISNPVASPVANTTYVATGINANGCADTDTVRIAVRIPVPFTVNPPVSLCKNLPAQLTAAGGDTYLWSPANLLSNSVISNPLATASSTTTFSVLITDTLCNNSSTLSTTVNVFPDPNIIINKSNDIDCSHLSATLSASGGASYSWAPSNTLNNPNLPNPVASPKVTTDYIVTVTDANDCTNKDSITVYVTDSNKGDYLMPSGFTPNNDGLNDCFGIKYWGLIEKLEFSIYNRWGERVFFTTDPAGCWDGTYKGQQQDGAVFVYMIKAKTDCQDNIFRKGTFVLIR